MTNNVATLIITLVTIVGLIVLIALNDLSASVGVPVISGLAGVHLGSNITTPST